MSERDDSAGGRSIATDATNAQLTNRKRTAAVPLRVRNPTFTAITVTYNSAAFIGAQAIGLRSQCGLASVVYVDNASTDETMDLLLAEQRGDGRVRVLPRAENQGFSRSCNEALPAVDTEFVLFLNPDVIMNESTLVARCIEVMMSEPDIGILGCRLMRANGDFDHAAKRGEPTVLASLTYLSGLDQCFPKSTLLGRYTARSVGVAESTDVDAVNGAFMLMRTSLARGLDGFDEDFWMYGEDLDLCRRARALGYRVRYHGSLEAIHLKGASNGGVRPARAQHAFLASMLLYRQKHGTFLERHLPRWFNGAVVEALMRLRRVVS